ncbi:hypothetical protein [Nitrosophilus alvini]|uniref:hypothetical protein n=1 Tax=Nitrosophilus alvini TaxID=2714855 RepID=UPI00190C47A5|nr:hypothetical protein [Nitrosophilus alvini]
MKKFSILLIPVLFSLSLFAQNLDKEKLLENMIKEYGGKQALQNAVSYIQHWKVTRASDKTIGADTRRVTLPKRLYIDITYPDKSETRILEGTIGIKVFNKRVKKQARGPMLDAMKVQLMRLYNPLVLKKFADVLKIRSDDKYYILTLSRNGVECDYYVNPQNYHIEKTVGKLKMGPGKMEFLTIYKDFSKESGVLMPHTEIKYAGSVNTATMKLIDTKFVRMKKVSTHRYESI